jgi:hypothetical protein
MESEKMVIIAIFLVFASLIGLGYYDMHNNQALKEQYIQCVNSSNDREVCSPIKDLLNIRK